MGSSVATALNLLTLWEPG